jgi:hypothetical protein
MKIIHHWNSKNLLDSPLFVPLQPIISQLNCKQFPVLDDWNRLLELKDRISVKSGRPLRFVAQELGKLGFESQYEPRCYLNGEVQTRDNNWHDCFNALVWLTFPKSKAAINIRHYLTLHQLAQNIPQGESGSQRGKERDMVTLLDESGVIVACSNYALAELLRTFNWKGLFWRQRSQLHNEMDFYVIGHGLYEKALQPYVGMTGQGLIVMVEAEFFKWSLDVKLAWLDQRVAYYVENSENCLTTRELQPVPLLGVPGWSADNMYEQYYDNSEYFRPGRRRQV